MKRFARSEDGFVYVMVLLFIPVLLGVALLVIDIGRGNNAHSDLYATADAVALAGARELDGGSDAIDRAKAAMGQLTNTVNMLAPSGGDMHIDLVYAGSNDEHFEVAFLTEIPSEDHIPIDAAWRAAHQPATQAEAQYVWVRAKSGQNHPLRPIFAVFEGIVGPIPIAATAVARAQSAACNVTPLYICNPFEGDGIVDLQTGFANGDLHGRLFKLHPKGNDTERPGNFGFLEVKDSPGADAIRDIFAGEPNPTCYESGQVTTKPGASTSIRQGINVRFDIFDASYSPRDFSPALNVRKGYVPKNLNNPKACDTEPWTDPNLGDDIFAGFPDNETMVTPTQGALGATIGEGNWDADRYWELNHGNATLPADMYQSFYNTSGPGAIGPSRYDVYRYEIDQQTSNQTLDDEGDWFTWGAGEGESGQPICSASVNSAVPPSDEPDRRVVFAAIIDCLSEAGQGKTDFNVNSYASIFLVSPMARDPSDPSLDSTIDVEIIDITGYGGNGTLDTFVRDEAVLVR
ncbi:TadE/TadG family type IV pilus assembly protein [Actibacterium sp. MT2.3-13A]|uniref:TadE/TadG family type IV pilus assembly protein n=1 Tax=Actibacterium sp. MT2.3-13A TaxID=2828332 RepID=UPI001BA532E9|nr:TadE/TadG family type IV pilus assembly protein [Actibacterium sp. MT2.3-13A]